MELESDCRALIRRALAAKDQERFELLLTGLVVVAGFDSADIDRFAHEELHRQPDDVREWWEGPCNCAGLLN